MKASSAVILAILTALFGAAIVCQAQDKSKAEPLPARIEMTRLLAGPAHKDIPCDMELSPARLTFQLRYLVRLRATLDPSTEDRRNKLDLYFVVRIADANGDWFSQQTHSHFPLEAGFDKDNAIEYETGFYAKPGKYTAALIVYDGVSGKTDVIRKPFEVKATGGNVLPDLDRDIPAIDFVAEVPTERPPVQAQTRSFRERRAAEFTAYNPEDAWPPAKGTDYLPVGNTRPLRVDVILNVAAPVDPYFEREMPGSLYRLATGMTVQAGAVLSQLLPSDGCVRISAIDLSKLDVVFESTEARNMDWSKTAKEFEDRSHNDTISVRALSHRTDTADFLAKYIRKIAEDKSGCGGGRPTGHAIVFVSREFSFPSGTHGTIFDPETDSSIRYFQVRLKRYGSGDDLARFFKSVKARKFDAGSPERFRDALARLVADLSGHSQDQN